MEVCKIGDTNEWGDVLRRENNPVQLWETRRGYFLVDLWVTEYDALHIVRKYRQDADKIFDNVSDMLK